jgi:hypothetical protein
MSKMFLNIVVAILALIGLAVIVVLVGAGSMMGGMMSGGMMGGGLWISLGFIVLLILAVAAIIWIFMQRRK